jgi:hypothetical protein
MEELDAIFKYSFIIQVLLLPLLHWTRHSIPATVGLLILLDSINCNPLALKILRKFNLLDEDAPQKNCTGSHIQVVLHKVMSVIQYLVAIYFLSPLLPPHILHIVLGFLVMRLIGIFYHAQSKNLSVFVLFFDFVKEFLLLFYLYYPNLTTAILIQSILLKIAYEYLTHKVKAFQKLNQYIEEI